MATRLELWDFGSRVGEGKEGVGDAAGLLFSVWAWREDGWNDMLSVPCAVVAVCRGMPSPLDVNCTPLSISSDHASRTCTSLHLSTLQVSVQPTTTAGEENQSNALLTTEPPVSRHEKKISAFGQKHCVARH
jgi:hypothetical protein